jgi:putative ABC transport system permease protein
MIMRRWLNWLSQTAAVTRLSLETVIERKGACAASVCGIAGVVAVLVAVLSIAQGFRRVMTVSGDPARALVLRGGSDTEMMSFLMGQETRLIGDAPGVLHGPDGPLLSSELFVVINLPKRSTGTDANVPLRGLSAGGFTVHDSVRLIEGRPFVAGRNEIIVGIGAVREFAGLTLGSRVSVGRSEWEVVGIFEAGGGVSESEIWTDATVLQSAYQRGNSFQTVVVRLERPEAFEEFERALMSDPRLNVKVVRQTDYYLEQSRTLHRLVTGLGTLVAGLMALGAVFGALNTMYSAVAARTREIATLRAIGFGGGPVVTSILIESLLLALVGGILGGGGAYLMFDGYQAATMNWQSFSQVAFAFQVTPGLLAQGMAWALGIGLIGGLFPALRAARLPVARALREL